MIKFLISIVVFFMILISPRLWSIEIVIRDLQLKQYISSIGVQYSQIKQAHELPSILRLKDNDRNLLAVDLKKYSNQNTQLPNLEIKDEILEFAFKSNLATTKIDLKNFLDGFILLNGKKIYLDSKLDYLKIRIKVFDVLNLKTSFHPIRELVESTAIAAPLSDDGSSNFRLSILAGILSQMKTDLVYLKSDDFPKSKDKLIQDILSVYKNIIRNHDPNFPLGLARFGCYENNFDYLNIDLYIFNSDKGLGRHEKPVQSLNRFHKEETPGKNKLYYGYCTSPPRSATEMMTRHNKTEVSQKRDFTADENGIINWVSGESNCAQLNSSIYKLSVNFLNPKAPSENGLLIFGELPKVVDSCCHIPNCEKTVNDAVEALLQEKFQSYKTLKSRGPKTTRRQGDQ